MAQNLLSEQEILEFREMFDLVDTARTGYIASADMRRLMETLRLRPTDEELEQTFCSANSDPTKGVDFDEFVTMMSRRVRSDYTPEQLRGAFKLFETEDMSPGFVSTEVLEHALVSYGTEKLTHEEAQRLLAAVDPDGTGRINYDEFVSMISSTDI